MAFFRRLLNFPRDVIARLRDKRRARRYPVGSGFPLKAAAFLHGAEHWISSQSPQATGAGRNWVGPLVDISSTGVSFHILPAAMTSQGERTRLRLILDDSELEIPCQVAYLRTGRDAARLGLALKFDDPATEKSYLQILEAVAMGATMAPWRPFRLRLNPRGLRREQYRSDNGARLYVWREKKGRQPHSFELHLAGHIVRGEAERLLQHPQVDVYTRQEGTKPEKAAVSDRRCGLSQGEHREVRLLYRLVAPSLAKAVALDARRFIEQFSP